MASLMSITLVDGVGPVLDTLMVTGAVKVEEAFRDGASKAEDYAKRNAPWADRTGNARAGLTAEVSMEMGEVVLTLFHTVDYGQWLELIQDGAYAIIMPTLEAVGPEIIREAGGKVMEIEGAFF